MIIVLENVYIGLAEYYSEKCFYGHKFISLTFNRKF